MTNTNAIEVLFEELCDEHIARISGGLSTATVTVSGDGHSSRATALVSNTAPTVPTINSPASVFSITSILGSSVNSSPSLEKTYTYDGNGVTVSITLPS